MRDRSKEIAMLEDTLKILKQGWYEKKAKGYSRNFPQKKCRRYRCTCRKR